MLVALGWSLLNLRDLLGQWSTAVPIRLDNRFQAWTIHWVQGALMGEHPLFDAATFAPAPDSLTFSDHLIGLAVVLLPLRWLGLSPAAVFNTGLVLGVVLTAVAGYALGYVLTHRRSAAVVAGTVFSVGPLPWVATTHIHLVWRLGLPLVAALVWVLADRAASRAVPGVAERNAWTRLPSDRALVILLATTVAWQGLVSFFSAVFVLLVAALVVIVRWRDLRGRLRAVFVAVGAGTLLFVPSYLPYLRTRSRLPGFNWSLDEIAFLRAAPHIVEDANLVWGGALGRPLYGTDGFHAFPGLTVTVLVVVGLTLLPAWRRRGGPGTVPTLGVVLLVVGSIAALGPGEGRWQDWTPYALAFRFVPGFSALRGSGRFVMVALLGVTVLAAMAAREVITRWEARVRSRDPGSTTAMTRPGASTAMAVAVALLVALVAGEGVNRGREVTPATVHAIDEVLADRPEAGGVVYLPVGYDTLFDFDVQEELVFRATAHDRPLVNGYAGFYPASARVLADRLVGLPDPAALGCLTTYDIRFVVVTELVGTGPWVDLTDPAQAGPLELVAEADGELLYRVPEGHVGGSGGTCPLPGVDDG
ncbi:hypothetical protein BH20ACT3_BH20ACT3_01570 [soil metagenome]